MLCFSLGSRLRGNDGIVRGNDVGVCVGHPPRSVCGRLGFRAPFASRKGYLRRVKRPGRYLVRSLSRERSWIFASAAKRQRLF